METITVACIKWGTLFGPEYVNRLYSGVRRNLSAPVRFLCMTEHAEGLHPDVEVLPLPEEPFHAEMAAALAVANRQGAMRKVSLFRPGLIEGLSGPVLGFDLDVVITGDLSPIWEMAPGKVAMRADWVEARRGRPTGHGSVFRYAPDRHGYLYEDIAKAPTAEVEKARGSEQRYTSLKAQGRGDFAYIDKDLVVSFKHDCLGLPPVNWLRPARLPDNARVVCFHGHPKMPEAVDGYSGSLLRYAKPVPWLQDHWIDRARDDLGADWT
ncbi:glycosyl transferase [Pelagovum pacificum]|uniref:Glycosyl transferase n=1 Tax=Pelagovum pacificum TaxID=2588711 RepID=A0A5C5GFH0_9RHOB|nr:glycosyl transferase [Pelagovum pacificum]QQA44044.1 glycosyl transferase [Pelagovum pacificum]TNY32827.1 glycosyl transferase [Pelagovum pacificum]